MPNSVGKLIQAGEAAASIEWEIDDFLSLHGDEYPSNSFNLLGANWCLKIYPYGDSKSESSKWIALHLKKMKSFNSEIVTFELGLKKADGILCLQQTFTRKYKWDKSYGIPNFVQRSELQERKEELMVSDTLTIVCKLKSLLPPTGLTTALGTGLKSILTSKKYSDVTIHVKDEVFEVHKIILAASSEVFSAMFEHEMSEKDSGIVSITDCEPELFKDFLLFLYTGRTHITESNVYDLYSIAHKYGVKELTAYCVACIVEKFSVDNICDVAIFGHQYLDDDLIFLCSEFFEENVRRILVTSQWKSMMKDHYLVAYKLLEYIAPNIAIQK